MSWIFPVLLIFYVASSLLCGDYLIFTKGATSAGSVLVIFCPLLNTYVYIKSVVKRKIIRKLVEEVKETIELV